MADKSEGKVSEDVIRAIGTRFKLYLDRQWRGNQTALADELEISQPAISRVAAGEQLPSGKLLLALREHTNINLDWLLSEHSGMLLGEEGTASAFGSRLPVADEPLPGGPADHALLLSGELIPGYGIVRPSQYWLRVQRHEPVVRASAQKIQVGDLILLETDPAFFPEPERVWQELWIIRRKEKKEIKYRLAEVRYEEADWYEADTFDLGSAQEPLGVRSKDLVARKVVILRK